MFQLCFVIVLLIIIMTFLEVVGDLLIFLHTPRHVRVNVPVIISLPLAAVTGTMTLIKAPKEPKIMVEPPYFRKRPLISTLPT